MHTHPHTHVNTQAVNLKTALKGLRQTGFSARPKRLSPPPAGGWEELQMNGRKKKNKFPKRRRTKVVGEKLKHFIFVKKKKEKKNLFFSRLCQCQRNWASFSASESETKPTQNTERKKLIWSNHLDLDIWALANQITCPGPVTPPWFGLEQTTLKLYSNVWLYWLEVIAFWSKLRLHSDFLDLTYLKLTSCH